MTIPQIKAALTMRALLAGEFGRTPRRDGMLCCPLHPDTNPSMQCFGDSNTVRCYSTNCAHAGVTIDVIDLVMRAGATTKAHAINRCKEIIRGGGLAPVAAAHPSAKPTAPAVPAPTDLPRAAVIQKAFAYYVRAVTHSPPVRDYLRARALDPALLRERGADVGYDSGQLHRARRAGEHLTAGLLAAGLLVPSPHKRRASTGQPAYRSFAPGSLAFALRDIDGNACGMYFRRVDGEGAAAAPGAHRHRYLRDRRGLWPRFPAVDTRRLVLAESVIDAASVLVALPTDDAPDAWHTLALYGTTGFTADHAAALAALPDLTEVCLLLDGDAAGRAAVASLAAKVREARPGVTVSATPTPDGSDANGLLVGEGAAAIAHLIEERVAVDEFGAGPPAATESAAPKSADESEGLPPSPDRRRHVGPDDASAEPVATPEPVAPALDTSRPHDLRLRARAGELRVKGFTPGAPDALRVTLQLRQTPPTT